MLPERAPRERVFASVGQPATNRSSDADVLVLSKRLDAPGGGVVDFVHSLLSHLPDRTRTEHLPIGRAPGRRNRLSAVLVPVVDNVRLARWALRNPSACIHVNPSLNWRSLLRDGTFLLTLSLVRHARTLVFFHGWSDAVAARIVRYPLLRTLFRMTFGRSAMICVLASKFESALIEMGVDARRVRRVTTMFDGDIFEAAARRPRDESLVVLFMGRLVREKGIFETLAAFASVADRLPQARLVVVGDGPELANCRREAAKHGISARVEFTGYLTGHAKAQALLDADLFAFPTCHTEGCPIALLEAMAAGLPAITNAVGGIPDVFVDRVNGVLTDGISVSALAMHMAALLSDRTLRVRIGETNRRVAWSTFEATVVTNRIVSLYRTVATRPFPEHS